jgi:UDP-glucose 4-epimerase
VRALITGGAGFIGSHLAEALLARGYEVVAFDDLSTGSLENIRSLLERPGFTFVHASILDPEAVNAQARSCQLIFHLGAAVGVKLIFEQPVRTIETNMKGTQVVLEAALQYGRSVFLASTSEVYGKDVRIDGGRFAESDDITLGTSIRWCYASSKALDEYLARAYHLEKGLPVVIGRFFNTAGPRQSDAYGMVVPRFVKQALRGKPITVHGDGRQVRSFGWVGDAVQAVCILMEDPKAVGEVYNIGSDEAVTIRDLAERVKHVTGSASSIEYIPYEEAYGSGFEDIRYRVPDISKIRAAIGYRPSKTLDQILHEIVAYLREPVQERGAARGR